MVEPDGTAAANGKEDAQASPETENLANGAEPPAEGGLLTDGALEPLGDEPPDEAILITSDGVSVDAMPAVRQVARRIERVVSKRMEVKAHKGPLPSPDDLMRYNEALPGLADRIVAMAESEQRHRHEMQRKSIFGAQEIAVRGQHYGLAIAVCVLAVATALILSGHEAAGTVIASIDLAALAAVFVIGQREPPADNSEASKTSSARAQNVEVAKAPEGEAQTPEA